MKLGKRPPRHDPRTLKLAKYIRIQELPAAPAVVDWTRAVPAWPMLANDRVGNCVEAGQLHMIMAWLANAVNQATAPTDQDAIALYSAITGYLPGDDSTDNGTDMLSALKYWRKTGICVGGTVHRIGAFAQVNVNDPRELKAALWLFGGLFTGWALPKSVQGATEWKVPLSGPRLCGKPGSWGGHCAPLASDDSTGELRAITWGALMPVAPGFPPVYCDECFAIISDDWLRNGQAPSGFNAGQLAADLAALDQPVPGTPVAVK